MDQAMQIPFKVSTATSNFIIGVTAAANAVPVSQPRLRESDDCHARDTGGACGINDRARFLARLPVTLLRRVFAIVVGVIALEMIWNGIEGKL